MATIHYVSLLAILFVLHSHIVKATVNPLTGDICRDNTVCGRGKCEVRRDSTFGFECNCDNGWIQARSRDDRYFKFLPCIIPDCLVNQDCFDALPAPRIIEQPDLSNFDPCSFIDCGGGRCRTTSPFTHVCECNNDYYNLLNSPAFPCYKRCAFGENCPSVGLDLANTTTSILGHTPGFSDRRINQAPSLIRGAEFARLITIVTTLATVYMEVYVKMMQ